MTNADGQNASYGRSTASTKFNVGWLQDVVGNLTGVKLGPNPWIDLNQIANEYGVQPVVFGSNPFRPMLVSASDVNDIRKTFVTNASSFGVDGALTTNTMTSTTAFTLPAGKTLYLGTLYASMNTAAGATIFSWQLLDNTNSVIVYKKDAVPAALAATTTVGDVMTFPTPLKYANPSATATASMVIQIKTDIAANAAKGNAGMIGWYE